MVRKMFKLTLRTYVTDLFCTRRSVSTENCQSLSENIKTCGNLEFLNF